MTVIARIVPVRVSKSLAVLVIDPDVTSGLALVLGFREQGLKAELATSFVNSIHSTGRTRFDAVVVSERSRLSSPQVSILAKLRTTRACVLLHEPGVPQDAAASSESLGVRLVPKSMPQGELVTMVRRALASRSPSVAKPQRKSVLMTAANGPTAGEFEMEWLPEPNPARLDARKTTERDLPVMSQGCG